MKPRESWRTTPLSRAPGAHVTNEKSAELATNKIPRYRARNLVEKDILYSVRSTFPMPAILQSFGLEWLEKKRRAPAVFGRTGPSGSRWPVSRPSLAHAVLGQCKD